MNKWVHLGQEVPGFPTIHVVSDGLGMTAQAVAKAAAACYGNQNPSIEILAKVGDPQVLRAELASHWAYHQDRHPEMAFVVFHTFVGLATVQVMREFAQAHPAAHVVDVLHGPVGALQAATGIDPSHEPSRLHIVDDRYFQRIEAMEFTLLHDDGRNPQDLTLADIVLIGVSRVSKSPLSIYLSQMGLKVANVPLDAKTDPPAELFDVDSTRLFGLMVDAQTLSEIRSRRLGDALSVAPDYADLASVYHDLECAQALMRRLGAMVVRTGNRAIEETAAEVLRYYDMAHPQYQRTSPQGGSRG